VTDRGTGKTTRMLQEAFALRANASAQPILIYGSDMMHVDALRCAFVQIAEKARVRITEQRRGRLVLDGDEVFEFRSYYEEDSPRGVGYSYIFRDHYAREMHDRRVCLEEGKTVGQDQKGD